MQKAIQKPRIQSKAPGGFEPFKYFTGFAFLNFGLVNLNKEEKPDRFMASNEEVSKSGLSIIWIDLNYLQKRDPSWEPLGLSF